MSFQKVWSISDENWIENIMRRICSIWMKENVWLLSTWMLIERRSLFVLFDEKYSNQDSNW